GSKVQRLDGPVRCNQAGTELTKAKLNHARGLRPPLGIVGNAAVSGNQVAILHKSWTQDEGGWIERLSPVARVHDPDFVDGDPRLAIVSKAACEDLPARSVEGDFQEAFVPRSIVNHDFQGADGNQIRSGGEGEGLGA